MVDGDDDDDDDDGNDDDGNLSGFLLGLTTSHAAFGCSLVWDFHHWWYSALIASISRHDMHENPAVLFYSPWNLRGW